jgi:predicted membrane-bound mannosyltransferase
VTEGSGHEKPWFYFLSLFGWQRSGGLLWQQLLFSGLGLGGALVALRHSHPFLRGALIYTTVVVVALSITPYKTPWHVIHLIPGLAVLAAGALAAIPYRSVAIVLAAFVFFSQWRQTNLAVFLRPADARNPYAYVHSSPDVRKVRGLAESALAHSPQGAIRVISEEYWPLPWYLRGLDRVGYWSLPPDDCDAAMILASPATTEAVRSRLRGRYRESFIGLRPGFICTVFIAETP